MIEQITVENLRSFRAPTTFRIAPITILLGQNSAGKSSITRLIPLLKQSVEQASSSAILWNSTYVDYGSIEEVLSRSPEHPAVAFSFSLTPSLIVRQLHSRTRTDHPASDIERLELRIELGVGTRGRTKTIRSVLEIDKDIVEFLYDRRGGINKVNVNGTSISELVPKVKIEGSQRSLAPVLHLGDFGQTYIGTEAAAFARSIGEAMSSDLRLSPTARFFQALARHLTYRPEPKFRGYLLSVLRSTDADIRISEQDLNGTTIEQVRTLTLIRDLPRITRMVRDQLYTDIYASQYIGPIRARAERYYRTQELAIDHIDPTGENMAMYLNFLTPTQLRRFNAVFSDSFGYSVEPLRSKGHVSLVLREKGSSFADNIADVGFGFSQVLPVIAQLFAATEDQTVRISTYTGRRRPIVAIEQPELHLHPAFQARLGNLFSNLLKRPSGEETRHRFLIETHSEALVNRFGRLISRGDIAPNDVAVYTFEKERHRTDTTVNLLHFTEDGLIKDWPVGFLSSL